MHNISELIASAKARKLNPQEARAIERDRMVEWLNERISSAATSLLPVAEPVTLTPVLAEILLERNAENRALSATIVDRIRRDIVAGHWEANGETIVISRDGRMNDGQHRCAAVVAANRAVPVIMVFGPTRESRMTLDMGIPRSVGHFLSMRGYSHTNSLAAVAGYIWQWKERGNLSSSGRLRPTKFEVQMVVEHYQDIPDSLSAVDRKGAGAVCSKSVLAFCHWAIWKSAGKVAADKFITSLIDGDALERSSPILYCRNRLLEMRSLHGAGGVQARAELILRCWNAYRNKDGATRIPLNGRLPKIAG